MSDHTLSADLKTILEQLGQLASEASNRGYDVSAELLREVGICLSGYVQGHQTDAQSPASATRVVEQLEGIFDPGLADKLVEHEAP